MTREKTTLDDYMRIAKSLEKLRRNGMDLNNELSRRFGKTKFGIPTVHNRILKVKSELEERMFRERPKGFELLSREERIEIFFGSDDPRSEEEKAI